MYIQLHDERKQRETILDVVRELCLSDAAEFTLLENWQMMNFQVFEPLPLIYAYLFGSGARQKHQVSEA